MAALSLTFVGSGDAFSSAGRLQSAIHLESHSGGLLLDCGSTLLAGLQRCAIDTDRIDAVAISHLHGDHFGGIPYLLLDALFVRKRARPLLVIGPEGTEERISALCRLLYPGALDAPLPFAVEYRELKPGESTAGTFFTLNLYPARHGQHAAAGSLRLTLDGRTIAYSGDTEWTPALIELADGSDLLICECCSFTPESPGHLDYQTISRHLTELNSRRIILTHTGASIDEYRPRIDLEIARDGLRLEL